VYWTGLKKKFCWPLSTATVLEVVHSAADWRSTRFRASMKSRVTTE